MVPPIVEAGPHHVLVAVGSWHLHVWPRDGFASWTFRSFGLGLRVPIGLA